MNKNDYLKEAVASIEEISDDFLDSDLQLAVKLRRIASKIALSVSDNEPPVSVDDSAKQIIERSVKEAVATRKSASLSQAKRKSSKKIK